MTLVRGGGKRLLRDAAASSQAAQTPEIAKVFWFFSSEKNSLRPSPNIGAREKFCRLRPEFLFDYYTLAPNSFLHRKRPAYAASSGRRHVISIFGVPGDDCDTKTQKKVRSFGCVPSRAKFRA